MNKNHWLFLKMFFLMLIVALLAQPIVGFIVHKFIAIETTKTTK